jgi:nucleoside diphosphate kinase
MDEMKMEMEITLCLLKPDALEQGLDDDILKKLTQDTGAGAIDIVDIKNFTATASQIRRFYQKPESWLEKKGEARMKELRIWGPHCTREDAIFAGKEIIDQLVVYLTRGEMTAVILKGINVINRVIEITGETEPISAKPGTIRRWATDSYRRSTIQHRALENLIHRSDSKLAVQAETPCLYTGPELVKIAPKIVSVWGSIPEEWIQEISC